MLNVIFFKDFNRMDDHGTGYDRRNFGPNRFNNNMPMRGGRGGNQFGPRMHSNYGSQGPRSGKLQIYIDDRLICALQIF